VLIVGDVHGDIERLFQALQPYPADEWHTVFLGDLVDGGDFGVGALRYARDRPNSTVILGNHEVLMLWTLWERRLMSLWASVGGKQHDLAELAKDEPLQEWLSERPLLVQLPDGTLVQHNDADFYGRLADYEEAGQVEAINREGARLLREHDYAALWDILSPGGMFRTSRTRLEQWLQRTGSTRLVHGHNPHGLSRPDSYQDGLAIDFDGGLSRYYGSRYRRRTPIAASVAPLP
jgi:calcineurin-like phosphoesterase family protein